MRHVHQACARAVRSPRLRTRWIRPATRLHRGWRHRGHRCDAMHARSVWGTGPASRRDQLVCRRLDTVRCAERPLVAVLFAAPERARRAGYLDLDALAVEGSPALSADELEIFFVSNRSGGAGAYDVWHSTRPSRTMPFAQPTNPANLNSAGDEWGLSLSPDSRRLYYSFNSPLSGGNADIWVATRGCL